MQFINNKKQYRPRHVVSDADEPEELLHKNAHSQKYEGLYEFAAASIFSLICVITAFIFIFRIVGVDGNSMYPTLQNKERVIISTLLYHPKRGDIVIIDRYPEEPLVKRVIAVAGDKIEIFPDSGKVSLNGVIMNEDYIHGQKTEPRDFGTGLKTVPDGYLVAMGDNREISKDSRSSEIGYIDEKNVVGKVFLRISPVDQFKLF